MDTSGDSHKHAGWGCLQTWIRVQTLPLTGCVTVDESTAERPRLPPGKAKASMGSVPSVRPAR
jgi:hypothetical protein